MTNESISASSMSELRAYIADAFGVGAGTAQLIVEYITNELACDWPHDTNCLWPVLQAHMDDIYDIIDDAPRFARFVTITDMSTWIADRYAISEDIADRITDVVRDELDRQLGCQWPHSADCVELVLDRLGDEVIYDLIPAEEA